ARPRPECRNPRVRLHRGQYRSLALSGGRRRQRRGRSGPRRNDLNGRIAMTLNAKLATFVSCAAAAAAVSWPSFAAAQDTPDRPAVLSQADVEAILERVSNWGR